MTKEEIEKFLNNTKVYVDGKSKEIQEKLFSLGYKWYDECTKVNHTDAPFLYINQAHYISRGRDMCIFIEHWHREISAEEILSLEITEPSYRAFLSHEECWREMHKHPDFGWLTRIDTGVYVHISRISQSYIIFDNVTYNYLEAFKYYTFIDGTPFGIKENRL